MKKRWHCAKYGRMSSAQVERKHCKKQNFKKGCKNLFLNGRPYAKMS